MKGVRGHAWIDNQSPRITRRIDKRLFVLYFTNCDKMRP